MFKRKNDKILNFAHRGARAWAPENTISAFAKALELGADGFELDVHLTADDQLVVIHDDELTRTTNIVEADFVRADHFVSSYSLAEIQQLDAGSWFVKQYQAGLWGNSSETYLNQLNDKEREVCLSADELVSYATGEVKVPSLEQVLVWVKQQGCLVNIELKTLPRMYQDIADKTVELVKRLGLENSVLISSFDHQQLVRVRELSDLYLGVLTSDRLTMIDQYLALLEAQAYHPGCYGAVDSLGFNSASGKLDVQEIRRCLAKGLDVNVWTCNDIESMRQLIDLNVSCIMSDMPNRLTSLLL